jgi:AraC-like DNA-binding protein
VVSIIRPNFSFSGKHRWHLVPLVVYFIFLVVAFYGQNYSLKWQIIDRYLFDLDWQFVTMDTLIKSSRFVYLMMSIYLINKYREQLKESRSNIENIDLTWLKILVLGFTAVTLVGVILSLSKVINLFQPVDINLQIFLGLTTYYADLILVCFLLFFSAANISSVEKVKDQSKNSYDDYQADDEYVSRILKFMDDEKPYLKSNITLDALSEFIDVPARELTAILNGHFKMNFYEFINNYRIKEAKEILAADSNQEKTISDIFLAVGFNSKSVFNTFFKKNVGLTPSEFRKNLK